VLIKLDGVGVVLVIERFQWLLFDSFQGVSLRFSVITITITMAVCLLLCAQKTSYAREMKKPLTRPVCI
jgi:hypothetical protein